MSDSFHLRKNMSYVPLLVLRGTYGPVGFNGNLWTDVHIFFLGT